MMIKYKIWDFLKNLACVGLLCWAANVPSVAFAELAANFPQLARVVGVANDDTLNIRAEPSGGSTDIGDLRPSSMIEVLEVDTTGKWARILHQEGSGWVSAKYLQTEPYQTTQNGVPLGLQCFGTEPFWSLGLNSERTLTFETQDRSAVTQMLLWDVGSRNSTAIFAVASSDVHAVIRATACSDGMSDRDYGWAVDVVLMQEDAPALLSGCCSAHLN